MVMGQGYTTHKVSGVPPVAEVIYNNNNKGKSDSRISET